MQKLQKFTLRTTMQTKKRINYTKVIRKINDSFFRKYFLLVILLLSINILSLMKQNNNSVITDNLLETHLFKEKTGNKFDYQNKIHNSFINNPRKSIQSITFPKIDLYPEPSDFSFIQNRLNGTYPSFNSSNFWKTDVRSCNLTEYDLSGREDDCMLSLFDSKTIWPSVLPGSFDPVTIMDIGKTPGLNVTTLHARGITGKNVGIGIIDQTLLVNHTEYYDQVRLYEEFHKPTAENDSSMHGPAVSSIAVGKNVGVAPEADLYFICAYNFVVNNSISERNYTFVARAVDRFIEINAYLPEDRKIRVISMSMGWSPQHKGYNEVEEAVKRAKNNGIHVISCRQDYPEYYGLGRHPFADPDLFSSYEPSLWWKNDIDLYPELYVNDKLLLAPMDSYSVASPTGINDYFFSRFGGLSWATPYIAGIYALVCQVKPEITPESFWLKALQTGEPMNYIVDGTSYTIGKIVNPTKLIDNIMNSYYLEHPPINITCDNDFKKYSFIHGNGTVNDPYIIEKLNITYANTDKNLVLIRDTTAHFQIKDSYLDGGEEGVLLQNVINGYVTNNTIKNSLYAGIEAYGSENVSIESNSFSKNQENAITLYFSSNCKISSNKLIDNIGQGVFSYHCSNILVDNNRISNNTRAGIFLNTCNKIDISNNQIKDQDFTGIHILESVQLNISNNTIYNVDTGILLYKTFNALVTRNSVTHTFNDDGLFIRFSTNATIINNTFSHNGRNGIFITQLSNDIVVLNNTLSYNIKGGISLWHHTTNNTVQNNSISQNSESGIILRNCSSFNLIVNNRISSNNEYGIDLWGDSNYNTIRCNIFIDNSNQFSQMSDNCISNLVEYNFWSEWTSPDNDGDGVVDLPYLIDGGAENRDLFPIANISKISEFLDTDQKNTSPAKITPSFTFFTLISVMLIIIIFKRKRNK